MNKIYNNAAQALDGALFDGMTIMAGGFGLCGIPEHCILALRDSGVKNLTVISNNCGVDDFGLGLMLKTRQIKKMISSYVGENKTFGIPAFFTKTGVGTIVAEGKETREFHGVTYVMETALRADLAIVKAWKSDSEGNLVFRKTSRNFNPLMAMAGKITVVEVEELVPNGALDPDHVHTPGIFVQRVFKGERFEKRIEFTTTREG
jgi:3-oxoacid CoA-transferase subunit A